MPNNESLNSDVIVLVNCTLKTNHNLIKKKFYLTGTSCHKNFKKNKNVGRVVCVSQD